MKQAGCALIWILLMSVPVLSQNCTTTPAMNVGNIVSGNMAVVGDNQGVNGCAADSTLPGCNGSTATGTITVNLTAIFNSQTGYLTLFRITNVGTTAASPGWNGTWAIYSGNNTAQIVLRAPGVAAGSFGGTWVTDLKYTRGATARDEVIEWSTPNFNSSSVVTFSSSLESGPANNIGESRVSQNTVTGVSYHSVTLSNLDPSSPIYPSWGLYGFSISSSCFTAGAPDPALTVVLPFPDQGSCAPGTNCGPNGFGACGATPLCFTAYSMQFQTGTPDIVVGQNTFTLQGYHNASYNTRVPVQDGIHQGYRSYPGGTVIIPYYIWDVTIPAGTTSGIAANFSVTDWSPPGLLSTYGITVPSGTSLSTQSLSVNMVLPSSVAVGGTACTNAGGTPLTLDDGVSSCAYPLKVSATKAGGGCGTTLYCGPAGTTVANCPGAPANCTLAETAQFWILVMDPATMLPAKGTVGPYQGRPGGAVGVACERFMNQTADGCLNQSWGTVGINGQYFSYEGQQQDNCAWNGSMSPGQVITAQANWFYDGAYVCHTLEAMYGTPQGRVTGVSMSNEHFVRHILGTWLTWYYPRRTDTTLTATYPVTATATITANPICTQIAASSAPGSCGIMTLPLADASPIAVMLAAGQTVRACFNTPGVAYGWNYSCGVLGTNAGTRPFTATLTAGGTLPASTTINLDMLYRRDPDGLMSWPSGITTSRVTDSTCPASGNCSITVSVPGIPNANGWDVYAWGGGAVYPCCKQNTGGPIPLTSSFVIGGTGTPLVTTGTGRPQASDYNTVTSTVLSADTTANTITVDTATYSPTPGVNSRVIAVKDFVGIVADTGSNTSTIVCSTCAFNTIQNWDTVYCGGAASPGEPLFSSAPYRGSLISSVDATNHTLHLLTPINCNAGVTFEIRTRGGPPGGLQIYNWGNSSYDQWQRFQNYMTADSVMLLTHLGCPVGGPYNNCTPPGIISSGNYYSSNFDYSSRREVSLATRNCQMALDINQDTAGNTALIPGGNCGTGSTIGPTALMQMIDTQINNGPQGGNGTTMGTFLNGLQMRSLLLWWLDPKRNAQNDPGYLYWSKSMANALWREYEGANTFPSSPCIAVGGTGITMAPGGIPQFPNEWGYIITKGGCGGAYSFTIGTRPASDFWSIFGNVYPVYAFLYQYTGNAPIPVANNLRPGATYGDAYATIAKWGFVYQATNASWLLHPKTLGEMGVWQTEALNWMQGTNAPPGPLTITTTSLPNGTIGIPYSGFLAATGGTLPYNWTATGLPVGLALSGATITGTPTTAATSTVQATVTDSATPSPAVATASFNVTIAPPSSTPVSITTTALPAGTVGTAYSTTLGATGGMTPYLWSATGLPSGLSINSATGQITGLPAVAGTGTVMATVTDSSSPAGMAAASLGLTINPSATISGIPSFAYPIP